jgi:NAD(P)-dependent dehydrogenase (short-subunit alcohol dehydrogenase family)
MCGPGNYDIDISLRRSFGLPFESSRLTLEGDLYNLTNHAQFSVGDYFWQLELRHGQRSGKQLARCSVVAAFRIPGKASTDSINRNLMGHPALDLNSKTAVVIGGTSGIGLALAKGLAVAGANVVPSGRRRELVESAAAEIETAGRGSLAITCDVADRSSLQALLEAVCAQFGKVDILVNCAGITQRVPTLEMNESDWNAILETNLNGTLRACQVFGRHMIERHYGRIINLGSLTSTLGMYEVAAYAASKAGVAALTKCLAIEWARHGVCVNALMPGVFRTDLNAALLDGPRGQEFLMRTPAARFGELEELVGAAVFLASDAASFVTGHLLAVDGGILASGVNR